eukprot:scaffold439_cov415-Prasinococcus_capsulatus_cf.AAC.51
MAERIIIIIGVVLGSRRVTTMQAATRASIIAPPVAKGVRSDALPPPNHHEQRRASAWRWLRSVASARP